MAPTLDCLDHVHIHVADRAQSEAWYARVQGLQRLPECEPWLPAQGPLTLGNAAATVQLALFERPVEKCHSVVAYGDHGHGVSCLACPSVRRPRPWCRGRRSSSCLVTLLQRPRRKSVRDNVL
jgi:hypothetical protein